MNRITRGLQKIAKGAMPNNPTTINELIDLYSKDDVIENFGYSLHERDERYVFNDTILNGGNNGSYCIFSSKRNIELMNEHIPIERRHILMDATFKVVPRGPFKQLLIIYVAYLKKVITRIDFRIFYVVHLVFSFIFDHRCLFFDYYCLGFSSRLHFDGS